VARPALSLVALARPVAVRTLAGPWTLLVAAAIQEAPKALA
jgi:hypothetical protein